jgi:hypothetical protein
MKYSRLIQGVLVIAVILQGILLSWIVWRPDPMTPNETFSPSDSPTSRVTNILVTDENGNSDILRQLTFSAITSVNGAVTLQTEPLQFGGTDGRVRWNGDHLEYSEDAGSSWIVLSEAQSLDSPIAFTNESGLFQWDSTQSRLEFSNDAGTTWAAIGAGGGNSDKALYSPDFTNTFLECTNEDQFTFLNSSTLQMRVFANLSSVTDAQNFLHRIEGKYACTMLRWGVTASSELFLEQGTAYVNETSCSSTTYTTSYTLESTMQDRWVEYAIQVNEGGNVTFYVDGDAAETQAMSAVMANQTSAGETLRLYEGVAGYAGRVNIGNVLTWATTGWKGIDLEGQTFPGGIFFIPLHTEEATITEEIQGDPFTVDGDLSWETVQGGL